MNYLRTELYQMLYENPIYPKNLNLNREPTNFCHGSFFILHLVGASSGLEHLGTPAP